MTDSAVSNSNACDRKLALDAIYPSDLLEMFAGFLRRVPAAAALAREIIQLRLVLDASFVQQEIRFLLRKNKPEARSSLQEIIDAGIVIALAPSFLKVEIEKYVSKISADTGKTVEEVREQWRQLRLRIHFYEPHHLEDPAAAIDPKDVPYKIAWQELGADAVVTRDPHLEQMGVEVLSDFPGNILRDYARSSSMSIGITVSSGLVITISCGAFWGAYKLLKKSLNMVTDLPLWAKLLSVAAIAVVFANPSARLKVLDFWTGFRDKFAGLQPGIVDGLDTVAMAYIKAREDAMAGRAKLDRMLPKQRRPTAIQHARIICVAANGPLSITEIASRIRAAGYVSKAKDFPRYVARQLRISGQFKEVGRGLWALQKQSAEKVT